MSDSRFDPPDKRDPKTKKDDGRQPSSQSNGETIRFQPDNTSAGFTADDAHTTVIPPVSADLKQTDRGAQKQNNGQTLLFGKIPLRIGLIAGGSLLALIIIIISIALLSAGGEMEEPPQSGTPLPTIAATEPPAPTATMPAADTTPEITDFAPAETPEVTEAPEELTDINPLTGVLLSEPSRYEYRPIAVMHNNIKAALPMHGISRADILYEMLAEGNITRLVGFYKEYADIVSLGAVRSTRTYYLELSMVHDAVLIHAGASYIAYNDIERWKMKTIDGIKGNYGRFFWRDQNRIKAGVSSEHTLFTSGENIQEAVNGFDRQKHSSDYSEALQFTFDGTPEDGKTAEKINVQFISSKTTSFQYDGSRQVYDVMEFGGAMIDGSNNTGVAVTNVVILKADMNQIPGDKEGRRSANLSTTGNGFFACGGLYIPIKWERSNYNSQFIYTTEDGEPLKLGAGKSYICIIPQSAPEPTFLRG